jgi:hypothetical protein
VGVELNHIYIYIYKGAFDLFLFDLIMTVRSWNIYHASIDGKPNGK